MTDRRLKRFLIPIEDIQALLKGGVVTGLPLPEDAKIRHAKYHPEFGVLELAVYSGEFQPCPPQWEEIPMTLNIPVIEAKS
jgi:hypothetical protein